MKTIKINDLENHYGENVLIQGFVENIRNLQYVIFMVIKDNTGKVQVTIEKENNDSLVNIVEKITLESTVKIIGTCNEAASVKLGGKEIIPTEVIVTSSSLEELPINIKDKSAALRETRLDYRFLDLRREDNNLLFKIETLLEHSMREYCINNNFMEIHSPKIAAAAAESGAETFKLDYFGQEASLSQSPQFYKQMAMAANFGKVFEIGPAFRAENSHTSYHATEINMADVEISWIDSFEDVMDMEEEWIKYSFKKVYEKYGEQIKKEFKTDLVNLDVKFPRVTFKEAKQILKDEYHFEGERADDFERKEEMLLCKYAKKKYNSDFIFVTKFPFAARPFYHNLDEEGLTNSYDLLFRGVEITTGAQREHRIDVLTKQIKVKEIDPASLEFYLEFFKYGCPPHGGFAIGIARVLMQMLNIDNIREATFIYRGPTRLKP
ncbi:MAG TPA: aspartate--tRNA(Asn) ligase [Bacilli bacterium]|nr:aspartate--tRNA(Asn) ligase [Bacilli bacterium]